MGRGMEIKILIRYEIEYECFLDVSMRTIP